MKITAKIFDLHPVNRDVGNATMVQPGFVSACSAYTRVRQKSMDLAELRPAVVFWGLAPELQVEITKLRGEVHSHMVSICRVIVVLPSPTSRGSSSMNIILKVGYWVVRPSRRGGVCRPHHKLWRRRNCQYCQMLVICRILRQGHSGRLSKLV